MSRTVPSRTLGALGYAIARELRERGGLGDAAALASPAATSHDVLDEWKLAVLNGHLVQAQYDQLAAFWNDQTTEYDFTPRGRARFLERIDADPEALQRRQEGWEEKDKAWLRTMRRGRFRKPTTARLAWIIVEFRWPPLELVEITSYGAVLSITTEENSTLLEWSGSPEEVVRGSTPLGIARQMLGIPAAILAQAAGIGNLSTMSQYETGTRQLTIKVQKDLERAMLLEEGSLDDARKAKQAASTLRESIPVGVVRLRVPTGSTLQLSIARACIRAVRERDDDEN